MSDTATKIRQAMRLAHEGKPQDAEAALRRMLQQQPTSGALNRAYSQLMIGLGDPKRAVQFALNAAQHNPSDPESLLHLGNLLLATGQHPPALEVFQRLLGLDPRRIEARAAAVSVLLMSGRSIDAEQMCREGLALRPKEPRLTLQLGLALLNSGRAREAVETFQAGLSASPNDVHLAEALASAHNYLPSADPAAARAAHERHAQLLAAQTRLPRPALACTPDPDRPLRIGFLSGDLRTHSVAFFLEPLLKNLDRSRFSVHLYSTGRTADATSQRLREHAAIWRNVSETDAARLVKGIAQDAVDVLVDLSGLAFGHRLAALSAKPAPVIVNYLGYPNTTGCRAVDARLVDSITDPTPGADARAVERLVRLDPCFLCYQPPTVTPELSAPVARRATVFGSFNSLPKINDELIALWARILDRTPGATLVVKNAGLVDGRVREWLGGRFAALGIPPDRLTLLPWTPDRADHLRAYESVDVALDTYPYHGTTTTCEALMMGVPVVTLAPPDGVHASRVGASLLTAAGMGHLIADRADRYVEIAAALGADRDRLAGARAELRAKLLASPLCDAAGHARRFESAIRSLWQGWCSAQTGARG